MFTETYTRHLILISTVATLHCIGSVQESYTGEMCKGGPFTLAQII